MHKNLHLSEGFKKQVRNKWENECKTNKATELPDLTRKLVKHSGSLPSLTELLQHLVQWLTPYNS